MTPISHRSRILLCLGLIALAGVLAGCRSTPVTGRRQVLLVPESQEVAMGAQAYQEILAKETPSSDPGYIKLVNRVGQRIASVSGRTDYQWEFRVIASPQQNAFCLPGGKVAVYEGILPVCGNEAGLAVVMSHEIAHALARHGGERMSHGALVEAGNKGLDWASQSRDPQQREMILGAYGAASKYGFVLPYSRTHESEADAIGLRLMAQAGYDPTEAPAFWHRFAAMKQGQQPPEFLSTHPSDARRASDLQEQLPRARELYASAPLQHGTGELIPIGPSAASNNNELADVSHTTNFAPRVGVAYVRNVAPDPRMPHDPFAGVEAANQPSSPAVTPAAAEQPSQESPIAAIHEVEAPVTPADVVEPEVEPTAEAVKPRPDVVPQAGIPDKASGKWTSRKPLPRKSPDEGWLPVVKPH